MTAAKILIVEDEGIIAKSLKAVLEELGYGISSITASGEEAIEKVKKDKPDLVLMDIMLKGDINGIEAAKKIKSDFNIPVIYLTAYTDKQILEQAKIAEPFGYIVKPFEDRELYSTIEMALYKSQMEKKIDRLNRMLRAFRNVNQLIIREKDRNILLQKTCTHLIETQGYFSAWVALLDETNKLITTAEAGLGKDFLPMVSLLKHGKLPDCITKALVKTELVVIKDASSICRECPISEKYCSKGALTIRLQSNNKIYGVLSVSIDVSLLPLDEELSLFTEVTEDIAFALRNIELEEGQKQAEEALADEATRRRILIEQSRDGIVVLDQDGNVFEANRRYCEMLGYSPEEMRRLHIWDWDTQWTHEQLLEMLRSVDETGDHFETSHRRKDGTFYDVEISTNGALCEGQKLVFCVCRDITERKRAEEALKLSEEQYRSIFENSVEGIYQSTLEGRFLSLNPAMARMHGYESPKEMIMSITNIGKQLHVDPEDRKRYKNLLEEHGIVEDFESQFYRKDGTIIWMSLSTRAVKDATGKVLYYEGIVGDITERKRAEKALRESETKLQAIFDTVGTGIIIIDSNTQIIIEANQTAIEMTGLPKERIIGQICHSLVCPAQAGKCPVKDLGQSVDHSERKMLCADGHLKDILKTVYPITIKGRDCYLESFIDISDRLRAEEALKLSEEKYRNIFENSIEGISQVTPEGRFISVNPALARMAGYDSPEEMIKSITNIGKQLYVNPEDRVRYKKMLEEQDIIKGFETQHYRKDGSIIWVLINTRAVKDEAGKVLYYEGTIEDITERLSAEQAGKLAEKELKQTSEKLRKALAGTIRAMAVTVETRDPYTAGHQRRVTDLARAIATELGLSADRIEGIRMAGVIHDIGKISVPAEILSKPTKLTDMEFNLIKVHPQSGYDILKEIDFPWPIAQMVYQHHEMLDGSGYPNGLKGESILLEAKILAVADVVEAMASHRPYRPSLGLDVALKEIEDNAGTLYDREVTEMCVRLFREKGFKFE